GWLATGLSRCGRLRACVLSGRLGASRQDQGRQEPSQASERGGTPSPGSHAESTPPPPPGFLRPNRLARAGLIDVFFAGVFVGLRDLDVVLGRVDRVHPVELLGGLLSILFGFLYTGRPGQQRLLGVGSELIVAPFYREGGPSQISCILVGLPDDVIAGTSLPGSNATRVT